MKKNVSWVLFLLFAAMPCLLQLACNSSNPTSTSTSAAPTVTSTPSATAIPTGAVESNSGLPKPAHIVIVFEENQNYSTIYPTGTSYNTGAAVTNSCPYINNTLIAGGALLTNYYGCGHKSEDNYDSMFFGNAINAYDDECPNWVQGDPSLGYELLQGGYTFCGYAEDLPSVGSTTCSSGEYSIHHCPWTQSITTEGGNMPVSCSQPFTSFPSSSNYSTLPTVSFVMPNENDDMHDSSPAAADTWLSNNMASYITWCQTSANNSLFILTWDEDGTTGTQGEGSTVGNTADNHIVTVVYGAAVTPGTYLESSAVNHYNLLATLLGMYSLDSIGYSIGASTIKDIF